MINNTASLSRAALKTSAASIVLAIGIMSTPSFAQITPTSNGTTPGQVALTEADTGEAIIVTGSRIARPDLTTASPIQILGQQEFQLSGAVNVEEVLYDLPQVVPSLTGASNNPGDGAATVDLRGLGAKRTLVLVNGRRWMSYDVTQIVDLNTIPASLVKRADVLTGGRGAVYGSDAIAGVVNFVLNDEFEGMQVDAGYRLTQQGDGATFNVSATIGTNFANGKGNVTVYASYAQRDPIFQADRSFTAVTQADDGDGTGLYPGGSGSIPGLRFSSGQIAGVSPLGVNTGKYVANPTPGGPPLLVGRNGIGNRKFATDGSYSPYTGADAFNYAPDNYLQLPQERWFMGGFAKYEVNEHVEAYMETAFVNNQVNTQLAPTPISGSFLVAVNSPYYSAATQATMLQLDQSEIVGVIDPSTKKIMLDANGLPIYANASAASPLKYSNGNVSGSTYQGDGKTVISTGRRLVEVGPRISKNNRDAYRILGGLRGEISGDWRYDGYYSFSRTTNTESQFGNVSRSKYQDAINTTGTTLATVACASGNAGCVPANIFGTGNISPAAADYMRISATNTTTLQEQVANFAVTNGNLFDFGMGAGPVGFAAGYEWRSEQGDFNPDTALSSGDVVGFNGGQRTIGGWSVSDLFAELNVPIVADKPGFYNLELNGAYRYSMYSNSVGNASTYSLGGQWAPIKGLTVRGQYQHALRAPSISELYTGIADSFPTFTDYCRQAVAATNATLKASCLANGVGAAAVGTKFGSGNSQIQSYIQGNANLEAETSNTWTVGAVIVPSQVPQLSLTVDYYNIDITNAINGAGPGATNIRDACFGTPNNGYVPYDTSYCALIPRDSAYEVDGLLNFNNNSGYIATSGIDANLQYGLNANFGFANESKFTLRLSVTYLINYETNPIAIVPDLLVNCTGHFGATCGDPYAVWRGSARVTWASGPLTTSLLWRYIGSTTDDGTAGDVAVTDLGAKSYFDLSASWNVSKNFSFLLGIDNLFNAGYPIVGTANAQQSNGYPSTYDPYGRRFFIGASATF